jgi:predicted lipoprotein with Yx(FWY)xxD motif
MKRFIPIFVIVAIAALVIAITSGGSSKAHKAAQTGAQTGAQAGSGPYGGRQAAGPPAASVGSAIALRDTKLGKILVDAKGRSLYLFEADKPNMSNCSGACQSLWPPLTSNAKPQAKGGVLAAKIGTTTGGAKQQVTYNGHPLYYYAGDQKPGDTTGQGLNQFGAAWYVLAATGNKIDND